MFKVVTFYNFKPIEDSKFLKEKLSAHCQNIKGTVIIAQEGINSTVSGPPEDIDNLIKELSCYFPDMQFKFSYVDYIPFHRLKIKIKKEIVTLRKSESDPTLHTGINVVPKDWNALISRPDIITVDVRNNYECRIGTFKGAINPKIDKFTQFPDFVKTHLEDKKDSPIALFCTGGIRVEKAAAYMLAHGVKQVYKLEGGILKYLEEIPGQESLWEGECFIFDQRIALKEKVKPGEHKLCFGCRMPLSQDDMACDKYEVGISCPYCYDNLTKDRKQRLSARQTQIFLQKKRGLKHIGR